MTLEYNKLKSGRVVGRSKSPRDLQMRHMYPTATLETVSDNSEVITSLNSKIENLHEKITKLILENTDLKLQIKDNYTVDDFNDSLVKALEKEIKAYDSKLKVDINTLKAEVKHLESIIQIKDESIEHLKNKPVIINNSIESEVTKTIENDRPDIEETVIDPTEKNDMESHIEVTPTKDKTDMSNKLSKLKDVLGGGL